MKKEFNPLVPISAYTGVLMCEFKDLKEYYEHITGRQTGSDFLIEDLRETWRGAIKGDYINAIKTINRAEIKMPIFGEMVSEISSPEQNERRK